MGSSITEAERGTEEGESLKEGSKSLVLGVREGLLVEEEEEVAVAVDKKGGVGLKGMDLGDRIGEYGMVFCGFEDVYMNGLSGFWLDGTGATEK